MANIEKSKLKLTMPEYAIMALMFICVIFFAWSQCVTGLMMQNFLEQYHVSSALGGRVSTMQSGGGFVAMLLGGMVADKIKNKINICIGSLAALVAVMFTISTVPPFAIFNLCYFLIGATGNLFTITYIAFLSDTYPHLRATLFSAGNVIYLIGSLTGPNLVAWRLNSGDKWNQTFFLMAMIAGIWCALFIVGVLFCNRKIKEMTATANVNRAEAESKSMVQTFKDWFNVLKNPQMIFLFFMGMMYYGHQMTLIIWMPSYLSEICGASTAVVAGMVSVYAGCMMAGRAGYMLISGLLSAKRAIYGGCILGGVALIIGVILGTPGVMIPIIGFAGIVTGAMTIWCQVEACDIFQNNSAACLSLVNVGTLLGEMAFPPLAGACIDAGNWQIAISFTYICLFVLAALHFIRRGLLKKNTVPAEAA